MTRRPKTRKAPWDPAAAARIAAETRSNPARWGTNDDSLALEANADVAQTQKADRGKVRQVKRFDCFELLKIDPNDVTSVRRMQLDMAIHMGVDGGRGESVQVDGGGGSKELVTDRMMLAGDRLTEALGPLLAREQRLLLALSTPEVRDGQRVNWKDVARKVTGAVSHKQLGDYVREACRALTASYQVIDQAPKSRRAA